MKKSQFFEDKSKIEKKLSAMNANEIVNYAKENKEARTFLLQQISEGRKNPYYEKLAYGADLGVLEIVKQLKGIDQHREEDPTKGKGI